jgi:hypothetical protein
MSQRDQFLEPGSAKHSPRVDDQMRYEVAPLTHGEPVESHTRDDLQQQGPAGHPGNRPDKPGTPAGLSTDDVDLRSQLASSLRPSAFPGDRSKLLAAARDENAPAESMALLQRLPEGTTWRSVEEVWEQAGGPAAGRRAAGA